MKSRKLLVRNLLEKAQAYRRYGEHFYEMLQPGRLCDFAAKNRSVQVKRMSALTGAQLNECVGKDRLEC